MKKIVFVFVLILSISLNYKVYSQDTLKYTSFQNGIKPKGEFIYYQSKDGFVYKVGDRLKIGYPSSNKSFAFISYGDGFFIPITQLEANKSGTETEIISFLIGGTKRSGFIAFARTKGITGLANYSIDIENSIATGELKSNGKTSDEALSELKKAKEKLDLDLITKEEFDKLKNELRKYIK